MVDRGITIEYDVVKCDDFGEFGICFYMFLFHAHFWNLDSLIYPKTLMNLPFSVRDDGRWKKMMPTGTLLDAGLVDILILS